MQVEMSNISSFTGKFRAQKQTQSTAKPSRRPRESAVCRQCRTAKLKCDRARPACGNCIRKASAEQCEYDHSINRRPADRRPNVAEDRLAHLESLVKELMHSQSTAKSQDPVKTHLLTPAESPDGDLTGRVEPATIDQTDYVGFTHWSAVLDEIDGLKSELKSSSDVEEQTESFPPTTSSLNREPIFGSPDSYSLQQIIEDNLPQKLEADRLLSIHFQGVYFILPFIHTYHFRSQYQQFWSDITNVNPLWLSILFSIFYLAARSRENNEPVDPKDEEAFAEQNRFHAAAGQCLVIGEYHRPQEFVVEALLLYAHCKSIMSLDPQRETGVIHSMAVRSAYQLGYHRDPDRFKGFTAFEGEMRRRSWAVCKQLDLMTSFQLGLPSSICLENCDTKQIRNLKDTDFGPDSRELPPSRLDEEITRLSWFVVKDGQMTSFAKVCRDALSQKEKSELDIRELDQEIRHMHESIPVVCKARPLSESIGDEPFIIITRIYLDFISLKSLCVLHRRYMARGNQFSTMACLNAGTAIVQQFIEIYREFAPGGLLHAERWMLGCYTMNDFLLGITVLCLFVHSQSKGKAEHIFGKEIQEKEVLDLLEQAQSICVAKSSASEDARRVARIVQYTLRRVRPSNGLPEVDQFTASSASLTTPHDPDFSMSLPSYQETSDMQWDEDPFGMFQPFSFTDNGMADIDWAMFDPSVPIQGS